MYVSDVSAHDGVGGMLLPQTLPPSHGHTHDAQEGCCHGEELTSLDPYNNLSPIANQN